MWTRQYKKRNTARLILPVLSAAVLAYFGFHAFQGEYGIYAKYRIEEEIERLNVEHAELRRQRIELERRVQLLHDGTLDRDMLDEQIRKSLNLSEADEVVIIRPIEAPTIN
jgi:cell division protein FtsB